MQNRRKHPAQLLRLRFDLHHVVSELVRSVQHRQDLHAFQIPNRAAKVVEADRRRRAPDVCEEVQVLLRQDQQLDRGTYAERYKREAEDVNFDTVPGPSR